MPTRRIKSSDLERLEGTVNDFVLKASDLLEQDHKKIDLVYDFLFLGQPNADPPIAPFVSMVQNAITSNKQEIISIKQIAGRFIWLLIGLVISGAGWFIGTTLIHILGSSK